MDNRSHVQLDAQIDALSQDNLTLTVNVRQPIFCRLVGGVRYQYLNALLVAMQKTQTADDYEALLIWNIASYVD